MATDSIDLAGKHFMTWGKKDCGKSFFNNFLMSQMTEPYVVFDPMQEHSDYGPDDVVLIPDNRRGEKAIRELNEAVEFTISNRDEFGYFIVDEVNRFHSKGGQLDGPLADMADYSAHYNMGFGCIARRPSQVHTDLRELAEYHFIFRLTGVNDIRALDDMVSGLGERVSQLQQREFYILHPDGSFEKHAPISASLQHHKGL